MKDFNCNVAVRISTIRKFFKPLTQNGATTDVNELLLDSLFTKVTANFIKHHQLFKSWLL